MELINVGVSPNDGSGDPLRTAFQKANANFELLNTASVFLLNITGLTGGGANNLDGIATVSIASPIVRSVVIGAVKSEYLLVFGTAAEASPGIILPDDYNAITNQKYWLQIS